MFEQNFFKPFLNLNTTWSESATCYVGHLTNWRAEPSDVVENKSIVLDREHWSHMGYINEQLKCD